MYVYSLMTPCYPPNISKHHLGNLVSRACYIIYIIKCKMNFADCKAWNVGGIDAHVGLKTGNIKRKIPLRWNSAWILKKEKMLWKSSTIVFQTWQFLGVNIVSIWYLCNSIQLKLMRYYPSSSSQNSTSSFPNPHFSHSFFGFPSQTSSSKSCFFCHQNLRSDLTRTRRRSLNHLTAVCPWK